MSLSAEKKKQYRALGHSLKPIVTIAGKGLAETVIKEIERALEDHELIKLKFMVLDRDLRQQLIQQVCATCNAELIQEIGKVALIFREAKKPNFRHSNIR